MFGLSTWEILIVLVMALIFIGPDQLPRVARKLGEGMRQVRGAMTRVDAEVRTAIREATAEDALAEEEEARRKAAAWVAPTHEHDAPPATLGPAPTTHNAPVPPDASEPVFEAASGGAVVVRPAAPAPDPTARRAPPNAVPRAPRPLAPTLTPVSLPPPAEPPPGGSPPA